MWCEQYEARTILTATPSKSFGRLFPAGFEISLYGAILFCSVSFTKGRCSSYWRFGVTISGATKRTALIQWAIQPVKFDYLRAAIPFVLPLFFSPAITLLQLRLSNQTPNPNKNTMSQPYFFCAVMRSQTSNATLNQKSQPYFFCSVQKSQPYFFCSVQKSK